MRLRAHIQKKYGSRHTNLYDVVNPIIKPSNVSPEPQVRSMALCLPHYACFEARSTLRKRYTYIYIYMCNYM